MAEDVGAAERGAGRHATTTGFVTTIESLRSREAHVGVVGLGYVGRPLAAALHRHFSVYGFDTDERLIRALRAGAGGTHAAEIRLLREMRNCLTSDPAVLRRCSFIVITVPTPITADRVPDLEPLRGAARTIGRNLRTGCVVVVESTVYPGVTEEVVGPVIARESGLKAGTGFHLGYSPERINPGDDTHTLEQLVKVIASNERPVSELMSAVYGAVTDAGVYQAESIRTAELAKVLENTQRDLNIALMNELAMICDRLAVDTRDVIRTAATKWNFARFEPGLVGGHCIGVDPYYLTHVAEQAGHTPQVILAGRQVNDAMGQYVAERTIALIRSARGSVERANILVLGFTFKENVPDVRNTRVADIIHALRGHGAQCSIFDPKADRDEIGGNYGFRVVDDVTRKAPYDAVIVAVRHDVFRSMFPLDAIKSILVPDHPVLIDVKAFYDKESAHAAGLLYWRL